MTTSKWITSAPLVPMLAEPSIRSMQISQVPVGHQLWEIERRGEWARVQGEDGYEGWVHQGYLVEVERCPAESDESYFVLEGALHCEDSQEMLRLPWGACIGKDSKGQFHLPSGQRGMFRGDAVSAKEQGERYPAIGSALIRSAQRWRGAPYQWGGMSALGVDCSGLVQQVYRLHGLLLPRDANLQAQYRSDAEERFVQHQEDGDLLFFENEAQGIYHVAIAVGLNRFIHANLAAGRVVEDSWDTQGTRLDVLRRDLRYRISLSTLLLQADRVAPCGGTEP